MRNEIDVVKFGSNLVADIQLGLDTEIIQQYAKGLSERYEDGLIVVTSGATVTGRVKAQNLYGHEAANSFSDKQCAGLGAVAVFSAWEAAFEDCGRGAASYPITHHQLERIPTMFRRIFRGKYETDFLDALRENARNGVVSVINEADAMSAVELMKLACGGDNDGLASHVARSVGARSLTLFAKKGGILDDQGNLIEIVDRSNIHDIREMARNREGSVTGRGGLLTKVDAAWEGAKYGIDTRVAATDITMAGRDATKFMVG